MNLSIQEVCLLLGEKDVLIYQLNKQLAEMTKRLAALEASKPVSAPEP